MPHPRSSQHNDIFQNQQQGFEFPPNSHLLITTPQNIFAWGSTGIHSIFRSTRGGIIAARQAKDGSGILAVASRNVVVMHDTKRGKEESWGLNAPQEEVRHLEYAPDAKSLFLSTKQDGAIQHYSTEVSRLLDPTQRHETVPTTLAVSSTGHIVLSASSDPPLVVLKDMVHNSSPTCLQPNASLAPVSCAVFHPERPNIFLLAFKDGTVAAYDATRAHRAKGLNPTDRTYVRDGEIAHIDNVHRATMAVDDVTGKTALAAPIAGAAFLPGFKTRAVTAGRDGKCKLIDFAKGGVVLRTWHAKAPLTAITITPLRQSAEARVQGTRTSSDHRNRASKSHLIGGSITTDCLIAVSRLDGVVQIYDGLGLLQHQRTVSSLEERILGVEWAKGPAPPSVDGLEAERRFSEDGGISLAKNLPKDVKPVSRGLAPPSKQSGLGLPATLKRNHKANPSTATNHTDKTQEEEGTVRYTPSRTRGPTKALPPGDFFDLFSPIKATNQCPPVLNNAPIASPQQRRPRISSQTFLKSPEADLEDNCPVSRPRNLALFPSTDSHETSVGIESHTLHAKRVSTSQSPRQTTRRMSASEKLKRHLTFMQSGDGSARSNKGVSARTPKTDARLLAELRRLKGDGTVGLKHGTLSSFPPSQHPRRAKNVDDEQATTRHDFQKPSAGNHADGSISYCQSSAPLTTDSPVTEDIWLTSESEGECGARQKRKRARLHRQVAGQLSPGHVDSKRTSCTTRRSQVPEAPCIVPHLRVTDGSTEEMFTAASHISPDAASPPHSSAIHELFPRSSSLSPRKKHSSSRKHAYLHASPTKRIALAEVTANSIPVNRTPNSPWSRLQARNDAKKLDSGLEDERIPAAAEAIPNRAFCTICPNTQIRVRNLEEEIAQLKGEVLALKSVLRKTGLPLPANPGALKRGAHRS